ncbi:hypothetical protein TRAPUB_7989 [Trametes pubescens]|uniref:Uncharacterized protein n=1 Tax=Trametes pubescens TaxID=154538 RepID=A0A1M2W6E3_TRAPU|nr:hypothetical protein TRAPUB_7989 [Trametes pubescens]
MPPTIPSTSEPTPRFEKQRIYQTLPLPRSAPQPSEPRTPETAGTHLSYFVAASDTESYRCVVQRGPSLRAKELTDTSKRSIAM